MPRKFQELFDKMPAASRARVDARVQKALKEMPRSELRRALEMAQQTVGDVLGMTQPEVSKLEQRSDALICSHLAMRVAPAKAIQELAGHQDLATTQQYMHLSPAALDAAIRLLDAGTQTSRRGNNLEAAGTGSVTA